MNKEDIFNKYLYKPGQEIKIKKKEFKLGKERKVQLHLVKVEKEGKSIEERNKVRTEV